jgi:long-subunit fatty acid transport protein
MKFKSLCLTLLLILASSTFSYAQLTDYNFLGGGARARGMGGAFFAVSDDPSAASWNPAGLTQLNKYQMGLTFNNNEYKTDFSEKIFNNSASLTNSETSDMTKNQISFGSVILPFTLSGKKLVGSVSYQRLSEVAGDHLFYNCNYLIEPQTDTYTWTNAAGTWDTTFTFPVYSKMHEIYRIYQIMTLIQGEKAGYDQSEYKFNWADFNLKEEIDGSLNMTTLALATSPVKDLSLGAGVNIYSGGYTLKGTQSKIQIIDTKNDTTLVPDTFYAELKPTVEADYSGFGLVFGGMYKIQNLRLGAVIKPARTIKEKEDVQLIWDEWSPLDPNPNPGTNRPRGVYYPVEFEEKWKFPLTWGGGASYKLKNLTVAADVEVFSYSKTELTYLMGSAYPEGDFMYAADPTAPKRTVKIKFEDGTQFRLGAEYLFATKYGKIPIRAGYRNDPKPFTNVTDVKIDSVVMTDIRNSADPLKDTLSTRGIYYTGTVGDKINGSIISLGTGIGWSQIMFDITYEFGSYEIKANGSRLGLTEGYDSFDQKVKRNESKIMINFTGFF